MINIFKVLLVIIGIASLGIVSAIFFMLGYDLVIAHFKDIQHHTYLGVLFFLAWNALMFIIINKLMDICDI